MSIPQLYIVCLYRCFIAVGALIKAMLVLGAQPLSTALDDTCGREDDLEYPDHRQGYGRVQMDQSLYFAEGSQVCMYVCICVCVWMRVYICMHT